jgi:molybdopterin synthase sulfur carrier subunit
MKITVLFFGVARDLAGERQLELELPASSNVGDLRRLLAQQFPGLDQDLAYALAINEKFSADDRTIHEGDVAAVLPPVSGG